MAHVDASIVSDVMDALRSAGLPADALQLEVTESVVLDYGHVGLEHVLRLRADRSASRSAILALAALIAGQVEARDVA